MFAVLGPLPLAYTGGRHALPVGRWYRPEGWRAAARSTSRVAAWFAGHGITIAEVLTHNGSFPFAAALGPPLCASHQPPDCAPKTGGYRRLDRVLHMAPSPA